MNNPINLSMDTAERLIHLILPDAIVYAALNAGEERIFRATSHPDGIKVACMNDWFFRNGRIMLTVYDANGNGSFTQFYDPNTLHRDFAAEKDKNLTDILTGIREAVHSLGTEESHRLVDFFQKEG
ncbi:MAG TPA: hypothetical protein IAC31_00960 [Candidatus Faecousia intestinigallinarum]|nr:hypothetical protein [Candidatus Faecousia intestinigallinarum]